MLSDGGAKSRLSENVDPSAALRMNSGIVAVEEGRGGYYCGPACRQAGLVLGDAGRGLNERWHAAKLPTALLLSIRLQPRNVALYTMLKDLIAKNRDGFRSLCEAHEVASLHAFGSSVHGGFNETSDVDLVVDLKTTDPLHFGELMLDLWDKLEVFFGRKVDLLTLRSVKNPVMREEIERTKVLVYDGSKAQVLV